MAVRALKIVLLGTLVSGIATTAYAADLYVPAPEEQVYAPTEASTWTGFYFGGELGYGWGQKDVFDTEEPEDFGSYAISGWLAGAEAGANWQMDQFVLGIEGDVNWAGISGDGLIDGDDPISTDINLLATLTGRAGLAWDQLLFYVEGGIAWVNENHTWNVDEEAVSYSGVGSVMGVGLAYAIDSNWSAKVEYNYMDFGAYEIEFPNAGEDVTFDQTVQTIKFGLNYKF